jgi:hypothetical protein
VIDDINKINVIEKYICGQGSKECETCLHAKPHDFVTSGHNNCTETCPFASGACITVSEYNKNKIGGIKMDYKWVHKFGTLRLNKEVDLAKLKEDIGKLETTDNITWKEIFPTLVMAEKEYKADH